MAGWQAYQRGDFATAVQQWAIIADKGDAVAQYNLGVMYDEGTGVAKDSDKAISWWEKAARQDHRMAQHNLALLHIERGGDDDIQKAVKWLTFAADAGFARSQYSLGKLYAAGLGVVKDDANAFKLIHEAGKAGIVKAQYNLGKLYRDGTGVEPNQLLSIAWFKRAAERGYGKAQERLATRYEKGIGVDRDVVEALKWATLAAKQGRPTAQEIRNRLLETMSSGQVAAAESRITAFRPRSSNR